MKQQVLYFLLIIVVAVSSCSKEWTYESAKNVVANDTIISQGNPTYRDTVLIIPPIFPPFKFEDNELNYDEQEVVLYSKFLPYKVVSPIFYELIDKNLSDQYYISDNEAKRVIEISVGILRSVTEKYKKEGKFVVIIGEQYGFYYLLQSFTKNEIDADKYIFVGDKLNIDDKIVSGFSNYKFTFADENGNIREAKYIQNKKMWAALKVYSNLISPNYLQILKERQSIDKIQVLFLVERSVVFGKLSSEEINFYKQPNLNSYFDEDLSYDRYDNIMNFIRSK